MNDLIGKIIAKRYRIVTFLGKGGMAEVYKVWDEERSVNLAMKVLYADYAEDKVFLRRFRREAQTLEKLNHPNIVRFYGLERDRDLIYLLMDYVDGSTLRKEIFQAEEPISIGRIIEVMNPICAALNYAHRTGYVHCDVKPANIMIHKNGSIYISDFGISRMTEAATVTMVGSGTPAYMSPEQVRGETPIPQTDIYALGVILFEMLTGGERPFTGDSANTTGSTSEKIRWEQMRLVPPLPSDVNPSIPPEMDRIVMKCLEKKSSSRYPNTVELLNDLTQQESVVNDSIRTTSASIQEIGSSNKLEGNEQDFQQSIPSKATNLAHRSSRHFSPSTRVFIVLASTVLGLFIAAIGISSLKNQQNFDSTSPVMPTSTPHPTSTRIRPTFTQTIPTSLPSPTLKPFPSFTVHPYDENTDTDAECVPCKVDGFEYPKELGHYYWNVVFPANTPAILSLGWCTIDQATLDTNWRLMDYELIIDGYKIDLSQLDRESRIETDNYCLIYQGVLEGWSIGVHKYIWIHHINKSLFDGWETYEIGDYIFEFTVSVE